MKYGQGLLDSSDAIDLEKDRQRYEADRAKDVRLSATHGIDEVMRAQRLDALLFPGGTGAGLAARPGYPTVIVPFALVPNAPQRHRFPPGFDAEASPVRRELHGNRVQRTAVDRARVRVRAGNEEANSAAAVSISAAAMA